MWCKACFLCLLLPLSAGAAPPPANARPGNTASQWHHYWQATDLITHDSLTTSQVASIFLGTSTDLAVQDLQQAAAQVVPAAPNSLVHFDLNRHVRVALVAAPRWQTNRLGDSTVNVALFSLQW
jgi:hypothetical protein